MSNPTRGLRIFHHSKEVHIYKWSNLSAEDPNEIIETGELIDYTKKGDSWIAFLVIKVNRATGETTEKGYQRYKKYYQVWQCYTNHEHSKPAFTEIDGSFLTEFPVQQSAHTKVKNKRSKLR